jgi:hypothetical protein
MTKLRKMKLVGHVACMGVKMNAEAIRKETTRENAI